MLGGSHETPNQNVSTGSLSLCHDVSRAGGLFSPPGRRERFIERLRKERKRGRAISFTGKLVGSGFGVLERDPVGRRE
jgi:hypothetical protein